MIGGRGVASQREGKMRIAIALPRIGLALLMLAVFMEGVIALDYHILQCSWFANTPIGPMPWSKMIVPVALCVLVPCVAGWIYAVIVRIMLKDISSKLRQEKTPAIHLNREHYPTFTSAHRHGGKFRTFRR